MAAAHHSNTISSERWRECGAEVVSAVMGQATGRPTCQETTAAATVVVTVLSRCASMVATVAAAIATRPHPQPIAPKLHASPCLQSLRPPTDSHRAADVHVCSSMLVTRL